MSRAKLSSGNPAPELRRSRREVLGKATLGGAALASTAFLACSRGRPRDAAAPRSSGASPRYGGTFSGLQTGNPPTLDPQQTGTNLTNLGVGAVMSRLFRFKVGPEPQVAVNHDIENDLAISAESPDAVTWTIKLRSDAKFHSISLVNGHPVDAEDVKATFTRALSLPNNPGRGALGYIDPAQIETPSRDTVVFKLKYPYAPFPKILASPTYSWIFPREVLTAAYDPTKQIIGSGPFILDNYTPDVALSFKKNPEWFEKGRPYVDGLRLAIIPDSAQQLAQFAGGNLDMFGGSAAISENDVETLTKGNPNVRVIAAPGTNSDIFYFQLGDPASPFQDIRLRRAVSLAIDRQAYAKVFFNDRYETAFSVPPTMGKWALSMNQLDSGIQQYYRFDLARAKQLVAEAGATNLELKMAYPFDLPELGFERRAQTVYNMLQALPWKITLVPISYVKDYIGGGKGYLYGNFPKDTIVFDGLTPFTETDQYLFGYYHSKSTTNEERLSDTALDAMIDRTRTVVNDEARRNAYLDVQKYIADKMYSVAGLPFGRSYTVIQPWVYDFDYTPESGNYVSTWMNLWLKK